MNILSKLFKGNPLASVTLASVLAVIGSYVTTHFDPSKLTPLGFEIYTVAVSVIGVLVHHQNPKPPTQ